MIVLALVGAWLVCGILASALCWYEIGPPSDSAEVAKVVAFGPVALFLACSLVAIDWYQHREGCRVKRLTE